MDKRLFIVITTPIAICVVALGTFLFVSLGYEDSATVLAGMLGFVGAIIGGTITWNGVNKTIENGNKTEKYKIMRSEYESNLLTIQSLAKMIGNVWGMKEEHLNYPEIVGHCRIKIDGNDGIINIAIKSSSQTYESIKKLLDFVESDFFYLMGEPEDDYDFMYGALKNKLDSVMIELTDEKRRLQKEINYNRL